MNVVDFRGDETRADRIDSNTLSAHFFGQSQIETVQRPLGAGLGAAP